MRANACNNGCSARYRKSTRRSSLMRLTSYRQLSSCSRSAECSVLSIVMNSTNTAAATTRLATAAGTMSTEESAATRGIMLGEKKGMCVNASQRFQRADCGRRQLCERILVEQPPDIGQREGAQCFEIVIDAAIFLALQPVMPQ